jgi:hypothetical protein
MIKFFTCATHAKATHVCTLININIHTHTHTVSVEYAMGYEERRPSAEFIASKRLSDKSGIGKHHGEHRAQLQTKYIAILF